MDMNRFGLFYSLRWDKPPCIDQWTEVFYFYAVFSIYQLLLLLSTLLSTILFTGCMTTPTLSEAERPQHCSQLIHATHHLHMITPRSTAMK